jgi:valyl-tRNA synthetase
MALLQEIIGAARTLKAEMKADPKRELEGELHAGEETLAVARDNAVAIRRLSGVTLSLVPRGARVEGAVRSTANFDLLLRLPAGDAEAQRKRLEKEVSDLEKVIANTERQLGDEKFLGKAPAHIVDGMRAKLADYQLQLSKNRETLGGL